MILPYIPLNLELLLLPSTVRIFHSAFKASYLESNPFLIKLKINIFNIIFLLLIFKFSVCNYHNIIKIIIKLKDIYYKAPEIKQ